MLKTCVGLRSSAKSAAFGGVLLAMIEGLGILLTRATAPPPAPPMMEMAPGGAPLPQPGQLITPLPTPDARVCVLMHPHVCYFARLQNCICCVHGMHHTQNYLC